MAIFKALELVQKDDIVLIAGKGHEDYQILKDGTIHFDDREVALEAIKSLGK
jgi:UDP-N-acetylmuramoyl-L-alanyl-D-glutamate--2,6-diaminopimelate ligase